MVAGWLDDTQPIKSNKTISNKEIDYEAKQRVDFD